jgi:hypothetical protein
VDAVADSGTANPEIVAAIESTSMSVSPALADRVMSSRSTQ